MDRVVATEFVILGVGYSVHRARELFVDMARVKETDCAGPRSSERVRDRVADSMTLPVGVGCTTS